MLDCSWVRFFLRLLSVDVDQASYCCACLLLLCCWFQDVGFVDSVWLLSGRDFSVSVLAAFVVTAYVGHNDVVYSGVMAGHEGIGAF